MSEQSSGYARLDDQIGWYDRKSLYHQSWYRRLKLVSIIAAALVPVVASFDGMALLTGLLGVAVVISEGLQHINQHHENWIRYRATCENLRHEKYLYLARSGLYAKLDDDEALRHLAAHVESILAEESDDWLKMRRRVDEPKEQVRGQSSA